MLRYTDNKIFEMLYKSKPNAAAVISGSEKYPSISGTLKLYGTEDGVFAVTLVYGLPKPEGACGKHIYAVHIHNGESCSGNKEDPFANAGTHYNSNDCPHPFHSGDMPPLFSSDSFAWGAFFTDRFTVEQVVGLPIVIHAMPDDFTTQPAGNSGEKIACGIIVRLN